MTRKQTKAEADYAAYLERCAEIDRRIEGGETITEIMRSQQLERGKAQIAAILEQDRLDRASDPVSIVDQLGAKWSPAFSRPGPLTITARDCVLCGPERDCQCRQCPATYENVYYLATGRPRFEPCTMRVDPQTGECPRGHRSDG